MNRQRDTLDPESLPALRRLADEDLLELMAQGAGGAVEIVYERHGRAAFSLAYRMCGDRALAEDVVQEAFLALWRTGERYDSARGSVRTWLLTIVHHRAIDALRRGAVHARRRGGDESAAEALDSGLRTDVEVVSRDEAGHVRTALDALPPEQSKVIQLAYFGGFTHAEIATMLDTPVGTVKGRMRLGLAKMRAVLDDPALAMP